MSKNKIAILLMILAVIVSACGGGAAPTATRPPATTAAESATEEATEAPVEATEEATEAAAEPTEEATVEATEEATEVATEEATEVALEPTVEATEEATEVATEEATVEATEEATEVATEEATEVALEPTVEMTEEATEVATEEPTEEPTIEATEEPTIEVTLEVTDEATAEATVEVTEVATEEPTEEPTEEATAEVTPLAEGTLLVQLQGEPRAGYAALYFAATQGDYEDADLEVAFVDEADDVALTDARFGVALLDDVVAAREDNDDLVIIGVLPDQLVIYTSAEWLEGETDGRLNEEIAKAFLTATLKAWFNCTTDAPACLRAVRERVSDATAADLDSTPPVFDTSGWEPGSFRTDLFEEAFDSLAAEMSAEAEATP